MASKGGGGLGALGGGGACRASGIMEARGAVDANGSDIFCNRELGAWITGRASPGNCDREGEPGGTGARAAVLDEEVEAEAEPDLPTAGELAIDPPGRGRRVAGEAICR
jgi:hypothetical protein